MSARWRRASLAWLGRHPAQLFLNILGIALGVAVVVAVDLAASSADRAFSLSMQRITGSATHRIVGPAQGLDERLYRQLRIARGIRSAAPVVEGFGRTEDTTLRILGLDPLAGGAAGDLVTISGAKLQRLIDQPHTALLAKVTAQRLGIQPGDPLQVTIAGQPRSLDIIGLLEARSGSSSTLAGLLIADIAHVQTWLDRVGRLDYIDLALDPTAADILAGSLPAGLHLEPASARARQGRDLTDAFRTNLLAMSLLAIIVGVFLIYNTMAFSVVQRRRLIAVLRGLGATRGMICGQILAETLLLGAVGTVAGLIVGTWLAQGLVGLITRTINDLYFVLTVRELFIDPIVLGRGALIGMLAALVAALGPALEAVGVPPDSAGRRSVLEATTHRAIPALAIGGLALIAISVGLLALPEGGLPAGFTALFIMIMGAALLMPLVILAMARVLAPVLGRLGGALGRMAATSVPATLSRTGLAVIALAVALAATVGVGIMVSSFRITVDHWLGRTLSADFYLSSPQRVAARHFAPLPDGLAAGIRQVDGVRAVATSWRQDVETSAGSVPLKVSDPVPASLQGLRFTAGERATALQRFRDGTAVLVSEPYTVHHAATLGDCITLHTPTGPLALPIAEVYTDYDTEQGIILMHRGLYNRHWPARDISSMGIYAEPGANLTQLAARLRTQANRYGAVRLRSSGRIRTQSLQVFDQTFAITGVLRSLVLIVAFVGVITALLALQLERARERAILHATGATPNQLRAHVLMQTLVLGLMAGILALPLGLALADILVDVINRRAFGWRIDLQIPLDAIWQALGLALAAAAVAGAWPAWRAGRTDTLEVLSPE